MPPSQAKLLYYLSRRNPSQLFRILNKLPRFGVGRHLTRNVWSVTDTGRKAVPNFWTIKKVIPAPNLQTGVVYGVLSIRGTSQQKSRRITNDLKREWLLLPKDFQQN